MDAPSVAPLDESSDSSDGTWPGPPPDASGRAAYPDVIWLAAAFDDCACGTSPRGRLVCSTGAMGRVLVRRGLGAEAAADHISPPQGLLLAGYPGFLD